MARDNEPQRSKAERIARLRERLDQIPQVQLDAVGMRVVGVIKGLLDLLADEL